MKLAQRLFANAYARRLGVAVLALAVLDPLVPGVVERAERARYESNRLFRFENSDLFALGPLVDYFREHPKGDTRRVVFFGDSVVWGYYIRAHETIPAQFQQLVPDQRVFNLGINGFSTESAVLISKAIIASVDTIYLFDISGRALRPLPSMIPVDDADVQRFRLDPPNRVEQWLRARIGFWNLYRDSYRLQAAWFGTSTRQYLYLNKADIARSVLRAVRREPARTLQASSDLGAVPTGVEVTIDRAPAMPSGESARSLSAAYPVQWGFASLVREHHKRAVVVEMSGHATSLSPGELGALNRLFDAHVQFVRLTVPQAMKADGLHLTPDGARAVAHALRAIHPGSHDRH